VPLPFVGEAPGGVSLSVRVIPRAGVTKIGGIRDGRLLLRLAAAPVDGAANEALIAFLAKSLGIPARNITVAAGQQDRNKRIVLSGASVERVSQRLAALLTAVRPSAPRA
jgi:uncharacterized protein YggU (UPF0235/DUF167 family)